MANTAIGICGGARSGAFVTPAPDIVALEFRSLRRGDGTAWTLPLGTRDDDNQVREPLVLLIAAESNPFVRRPVFLSPGARRVLPHRLNADVLTAFAVLVERIVEHHRPRLGR